jgi:hypothetical protein
MATKSNFRATGLFLLDDDATENTAGGPASGPVQGCLLLDTTSGLGGKSGPEAKSGSVIG